MQQRAGIAPSCQTLERADLGFAATVAAGTTNSVVLNGGGVRCFTWYLSYTQATGNVTPNLRVLLEDGSTVVRTFSVNGAAINGNATPPEYHLSWGQAAAGQLSTPFLACSNFQLQLVVVTTNVTLLVTQLVLFR